MIGATEHFRGIEINIWTWSDALLDPAFLRRRIVKRPAWMSLIFAKNIFGADATETCTCNHRKNTGCMQYKLAVN